MPTDIVLDDRDCMKFPGNWAPGYQACRDGTEYDVETQQSNTAPHLLGINSAAFPNSLVVDDGIPLIEEQWAIMYQGKYASADLVYTSSTETTFVGLRNSVLGPDPEVERDHIPQMHRFHDADDEHPFVNSVYPVGECDQIRQDRGRNARSGSIAQNDAFGSIDVAKELAFVPDRQFKPVMNFWHQAYVNVKSHMPTYFEGTLEAPFPGYDPNCWWQSPHPSLQYQRLAMRVVSFYYRDPCNRAGLEHEDSGPFDADLHDVLLPRCLWHHKVIADYCREKGCTLEHVLDSLTALYDVLGLQQSPFRLGVDTPRSPGGRAIFRHSSKTAKFLAMLLPKFSVKPKGPYDLERRTTYFQTGAPAFTKHKFGRFIEKMNDFFMGTTVGADFTTYDECWKGLEVDTTTLGLSATKGQSDDAEKSVPVEEEHSHTTGDTQPGATDDLTTGVTQPAVSTSNSSGMDVDADLDGPGDIVNVPMVDQEVSNLFRALIHAGSSHLSRLCEAGTRYKIDNSKDILKRDIDAIFQDVPEDFGSATCTPQHVSCKGANLSPWISNLLPGHHMECEETQHWAMTLSGRIGFHSEHSSCVGRMGGSLVAPNQSHPDSDRNNLHRLHFSPADLHTQPISADGSLFDNWRRNAFKDTRVPPGAAGASGLPVGGESFGASASDESAAVPASSASQYDQETPPIKKRAVPNFDDNYTLYGYESTRRFLFPETPADRYIIPDTLRALPGFKDWVRDSGKADIGTRLSDTVILKMINHKRVRGILPNGPVNWMVSAGNLPGGERTPYTRAAGQRNDYPDRVRRSCEAAKHTMFSTLSEEQTQHKLLQDTSSTYFAEVGFQGQDSHRDLNLKGVRPDMEGIPDVSRGARENDFSTAGNNDHENRKYDQNSAVHPVCDWPVSSAWTRMRRSSSATRRPTAPRPPPRSAA